MRSDQDIQNDVEDAIKWESSLRGVAIGVAVNKGIATLSGTVDGYAKKLEVEDLAKKVEGVNAVVEKIELALTGTSKKTDVEIATEVLEVLKRSWKVPNDTIRIMVDAGWVTLEGERQWNYQIVALKNSVHDLPGVRGITNKVKIEAGNYDAIDQKEIERALARIRSINGRDIKVRISASKVTLTGNVHSSYEKDEAERIAWNAPGIWHVENDLVIVSDPVMG